MFAEARTAAAKSAPTVVGESLGMVACDDFAQDRRDVFLVVWAVDAGDEKVTRLIRLVGGVYGEPVRTGLKAVRVRPIRVHASEDRKPVLMRSAAQLAEQVTPVKVFCLAMKGHLTGVIGNDTTSVDDDPLDVGALPVTAPPSDVIALRVNLGDIGLPPACDAPKPWNSLSWTSLILVRSGRRVEPGACNCHGTSGQLLEERPATFSAILALT